jgi:NADP-dependent 3-hydroxy acid dehydrogenase YdfG
MYLQKINLKNKYALITGAGKGLGKACSIALAEAGATVIALSRTPSDLDKLEKQIKKIKGKIIKVPCDVMDYEDLKKKIDKIKIIDVLVNNAGHKYSRTF